MYKKGEINMLIELQCSNCGNKVSREPTEFWKYGWRFTGVPYCPCCIKTWKEMGKNGMSNTMKNI